MKNTITLSQCREVCYTTTLIKDKNPTLQIGQALYFALHSVVPKLLKEIMESNDSLQVLNTVEIQTYDDVKVWLLKLSKEVDPDPDYPNYELEEIEETQ